MCTQGDPSPRSSTNVCSLVSNGLTSPASLGSGHLAEVLGYINFLAAGAVQSAFVSGLTIDIAQGKIIPTKDRGGSFVCWDPNI